MKERKTPERRPTCDCHDREIHGGRFQRCRKAAETRLRRTDIENPIWFDYCRHCADTIKAQQGSSVKEG